MKMLSNEQKNPPAFYADWDWFPLNKSKSAHAYSAISVVENRKQSMPEIFIILKKVLFGEDREMWFQWNFSKLFASQNDILVVQWCERKVKRIQRTQNNNCRYEIFLFFVLSYRGYQ